MKYRKYLKKEIEDFEMIELNNQRLLSLVDQLLEISKIESGTQKLRIKEGNVLDFIKTIANYFVHKAEHKDIDYRLYIDNKILKS